MASVQVNLTEAESHEPSWRVWLLRAIKALEWAAFVYGVPGMLLLVLLVALWTVPALLIMAGLLALQAPIWLAFRRFLPRGADLPPEPPADRGYRSFHDWLEPRDDAPMTGPSLNSWVRLDRAQRRR